MNEDFKQWIPVIAIIGSLLGGGAVGALITAFITNRRNRVQPVGFRMEYINIFTHKEGISSLHPKLTLVDEIDKQYSFDNLLIARIIIVNKGNQDMPEFAFGLTLHGGDKAIYAQEETPDRHHIAAVTQRIKLDSPTAEIDYTLKPFNRNDSYIFNLFVTSAENDTPHRPIEVSSIHSVKFVSLPTLSETTINVLSLLSELPIRIPK